MQQLLLRAAGKTGILPIHSYEMQTLHFGTSSLRASRLDSDLTDGSKVEEGVVYAYFTCEEC